MKITDNLNVFQNVQYQNPIAFGNGVKLRQNLLILRTLLRVVRLNFAKHEKKQGLSGNTNSFLIIFF